MGAPQKKVTKSTLLSIRLEPKDYEDFNKLCHLEFSHMAPFARQLIIDWIEKNRKKLK